MTLTNTPGNRPATEAAPNAAANAGNAGNAVSAVKGWVRKHRAWTVVCLVFAVGMVPTVISRLTPGADTAPLSTHNPAPEGARAAAEILRTHGVDVRQSESFETTMSSIGTNAGEDLATTVLLYDRNGYLDRDQLQRLGAAADLLVVVTPRLNTLGALGSDIRPAGVVPASVDTLDPGCRLADPAAAGTVTADDAFLYKGPRLCYQPAEDFGGLYASSGDGRLVVLGSTQIISNAQLDEQGNAALVLRTLGSSGKLIWYLPGLADITASDSPKSLDELAPPWVGVLGPWLAFVAVLAMFWRGRRLGPLVFEPLPVVVKAVETAEGRARLYHDAHAVGRAADNLRAGTLVRLARFLRLGPEPEAASIAEAAARQLGRTSEETSDVLNARPRTDGELVRWAQQLDRLEKEVTAP